MRIVSDLTIIIHKTLILVRRYSLNFTFIYLNLIFSEFLLILSPTEFMSFMSIPATTRNWLQVAYRKRDRHLRRAIES